jgi:hypothetical protein
MQQPCFRAVLIAVALQALACSRGGSHPNVAGTPVAPPIPVPVHETAVRACDAGPDACAGQGTGPGDLCDPGLVACPGPGTGYCFDLQASPEHCGTCDHACALGSPCEHGQCRVHACTSQVSVTSLATDNGGAAYNHPALLDCNRDGALDMIALSPAITITSKTPDEDVKQSVTVYRGNSDGTFALGERYRLLLSPAIWTIHHLLAADLNRDQIPDMIIMGSPWSEEFSDESQNTVIVRLGQGDCTFGPEIGLASGIRPISIVVADLDGDDILDLAMSAEKGQLVRTFHGNGDGSFSKAQDLTVSGDHSLLAVTDFNADGIADLVAAEELVHVLLGTGHGQFAPTLDCALRSGDQSFGLPWFPPVIADFDQDGTADMAINNTVLFGMHECDYQRLVTFSASENRAFPLLADDLNGDGALDLVFSDADGVQLLPGDRHGGFGAVVTLGDFDKEKGRDGEDREGIDLNTSVYAGDFNGDGRLDLAVANNISLRTFINTCR